MRIVFNKDHVAERSNRRGRAGRRARGGGVREQRLAIGADAGRRAGRGRRKLLGQHRVTARRRPRAGHVDHQRPGDRSPPLRVGRARRRRRGPRATRRGERARVRRLRRQVAVGVVERSSHDTHRREGARRDGNRREPASLVRRSRGAQGRGGNRRATVGRRSDRPGDVRAQPRDVRRVTRAGARGDRRDPHEASGRARRLYGARTRVSADRGRARREDA